jgi:hypothetical protein
MFTNKAPGHLHNTDVFVCGRSLILYVYMYIWTSVFAYFTVPSMIPLPNEIPLPSSQDNLPHKDTCFLFFCILHV